MSYEMKASDVYAFAGSVGAITRERGDELDFKYCPQCQGGMHRDEYTFSINLRSGACCCQRSSCQLKGHFVELCRDFNFPLEFETPRIYKNLPQPKTAIKPKDEAISYLETRSISAEVAERFEITVSSKNKNVLVFPFYNEVGKLLFVKYRNTKFKKGDKGNKEWCEKDTMPILFGMKQCVDFERLIVTEGQLDSLSVAEAGFDNAVSVPTGANGFTWWMPCKEWIEKFKEIIIFGDYEKGKITLLDWFVARVPEKVKVVRKQDYLGEKDANDILRKYGPEAIRKCINNAEVPQIDNVKDLSLVESIDLNTLETIKTGIWSLDRTIKGLCMGTLTVLSGRRGEGKSTLASQIICSALEQGETVFAYSGELANYHFKRWLDCQLAGTDNMIQSENEYGEIEYSISEDVVQKINSWYHGRMYIYDNNYVAPEGQEMESLPVTIERVIKHYGARLIVVDNLMTAMSEVDNQDNLYLAQSNFVAKLKLIAVKYNVAILLVAHPKKSKGQLDNDDISGSSDITNKADTVLTYAKAEPKISGEEREDYDNYLNVIKNRLRGTLVLGKENSIKLIFSKSSKRIEDAERLNRQVYGWAKVEDLKDEQLTINDDLPF